MVRNILLLGIEEAQGTQPQKCWVYTDKFVQVAHIGGLHGLGVDGSSVSSNAAFSGCNLGHFAAMRNNLEVVRYIKEGKVCSLQTRAQLTPAPSKKSTTATMRVSVTPGMLAILFGWRDMMQLLEISRRTALLIICQHQQMTFDLQGKLVERFWDDMFLNKALTFLTAPEVYKLLALVSWQSVCKFYSDILSFSGLQDDR